MYRRISLHSPDKIKLPVRPQEELAQVWTESIKNHFPTELSVAKTIGNAIKRNYGDAFLGLDLTGSALLTPEKSNDLDFVLSISDDLFFGQKAIADVQMLLAFPPLNKYEINTELCRITGAYTNIELTPIDHASGLKPITISVKPPVARGREGVAKSFGILDSVSLRLVSGNEEVSDMVAVDKDPHYTQNPFSMRCAEILNLLNGELVNYFAHANNTYSLFHALVVKARVGDNLRITERMFQKWLGCNPSSNLDFLNKVDHFASKLGVQRAQFFEMLYKVYSSYPSNNQSYLHSCQTLYCHPEFVQIHMQHLQVANWAPYQAHNQTQTERSRSSSSLSPDARPFTPSSSNSLDRSTPSSVDRLSPGSDQSAETPPEAASSDGSPTWFDGTLFRESQDKSQKPTGSVKEPRRRGQPRNATANSANSRKPNEKF